MGGQAAEQIIAGVVLSERLAVTMYGAIHRAQWNGQRNMRGLVVDPKLLAVPAFRVAMDEASAIASASLDHPNVVPTIAVETNGPDVVVVTRGVGRYVSVQDLMTMARASRVAGGKLALPVAAAIGKSVVEALAAAHRAKLVHGAVHPRSVLIDEDGGVCLGDFVVGRALTTAVAQGADSSLWRGLAGFLAPELAVGEDPSPASDVFAAGALLFTMLSGEIPPGTLHVTPAVERLVQRALDTDLVRRYKNAGDLLENMLEAFEDDRWEVADRGEMIRAAGLSHADDNIDDATEDLLASLGSMPGAVQVTPIRPSVDIRAEAAAARHHTSTAQNRLDALLADLDDSREHTAVDDPRAFKRDPISELIHMDPRRDEAIVPPPRPARSRVPSLDDPDDDEADAEHTPLPPPMRESDTDLVRGGRPGERAERSATYDEAAAMDALSGLDEPVRRVSSAADQAAQAAERLEQAARRAEAAAARVETRENKPLVAPSPRAAAPLVDPVPDLGALDAPAPRLRSRMFGVVLLLLVGGAGAGFYYLYQRQQASNEEGARKQAQLRAEAEQKTQLATGALADPGAIEVQSTPAQAGVWLRLGRTPVNTMRLQANSTHELAFLLEGHALGEAQVGTASWIGDKAGQKAAIEVVLQPLSGKQASPAELPLQPTAVHGPSTAAGAGPIAVSSKPAGAEAYLYIGLTGSMRFNQLTAGRDYELVVIKTGYKPHHLTIKADDWRSGNDLDTPIDVAKKLSVIERTVTLEPLPRDKGK